MQRWYLGVRMNSYEPGLDEPVHLEGSREETAMRQCNWFGLDRQVKRLTSAL